MNRTTAISYARCSLGYARRAIHRNLKLQWLRRASLYRYLASGRYAALIAAEQGLVMCPQCARWHAAGKIECPHCHLPTRTRKDWLLASRGK